MTHGEKVAERLVTTNDYSLFIGNVFICGGIDKMQLQDRVKDARVVIAREIDAARKNTRRKTK